MTITAIIAEYNPFHNGHAYQIQKAKELTNADAIIVIMSGNFMQRGEPALIDKHARTQMALAGGADLVIELPVCYACGSAEYFAKGAVSILNKLGCVDYLCFGSECGDINLLLQIADVLNNEPEEYKTKLKQVLKEGDSFPVARKKALQDYFLLAQDSFRFSSRTENFDFSVLESPNNILGLEYLKALLVTKSSIKPVTIKRIGNSYHDRDLSCSFSADDTVCLSSATAIRSELMLHQKQPDATFGDLQDKTFIPSFDRLLEHVPPESLSILQKAYNSSCPICADDFSGLLHYKLLSDTAKKDSLCFAHYLDITEDFSDKVTKLLYEYKTFYSFCSLLKSKDLTYTRISRGLLHILLDLTKADMDSYIAEGATFYARILGIRKDKSELTARLKKDSSIPLITRPAKAIGQLSATGQLQFHSDLFASTVYESVVAQKFHKPMQNEFTRQIITI